MPLHRRYRAALIAVAAICAGPPASGDDPPRPDSEEMRAAADRVVMEVIRDGARERVPLRKAPIYRFNEPDRGYLDGMIWACGREGRPEALLTVSQQERAVGIDWVYELTSLSEAPLTAAGPDWARSWEPGPAELGFAGFPNADRPDGNEARRLRQMKELARGFRAHGFTRSDSSPRPLRHELRLLPQPVLRYADPARGLIDGAIFVLASGGNPEGVLLVEARREGAGEPSWTFGLARISAAELHVDLEGKEVWSVPQNHDFSPRESYWLYLTRKVDGR